MQAPNANIITDAAPDQAQPQQQPLPAHEDPQHISSLEKAEEALIRQFEDEQRRPDSVSSVIDKMEEDREYVHTGANVPDVPGGVASNYILRYQWIHQAQIYAKDPSLSVRPKRKLGQMVPVVQQILSDFGKTIEYIVKHCADEGKLRSIVDGMIQDTDTSGIVFLKVNWIEDLGKDPIGTFRPFSFQSNVRRLQRLAEDFAEGKFTQTDAQFFEMKTVAEDVQAEADAEHWRQTAYPTKRPAIGPDGLPHLDDTGVPVLEDIPYPPDQDPRKLRWTGAPTPPQITELPRYRSFVFDVFDAEDVTWDWRIRRPELLHRSAHIETRAWMSRAQIMEDYGLAADDSDDYFPAGHTEMVNSGDGVRRTQDISDATSNDERSGHMAVWERQSIDGQLHVWVHGAKKFLRQVKRDVMTSSRYNIFALWFNRASGRFMPVSNVSLGRPLQDEINTVRTHKRQAKRAAYNRYITQKDLFDDDEKKRLERCPPEGMVAVNKPIEDIRKGIFQINGQFNAQVHDVSEERQELATMLGVSVAAGGQTRGGSDTATEASIANQYSGQMADKHRAQLEAFLHEVFTYMAEVLVQALPEENAKAIAGPGAVWPMIDREAIWNHLEVDIEAGSTGKPDQKANLDAMQQTMQIGQLMGIGMNPMAPTWNYRSVVRKLADLNDWRDDPESLLQMPALPPMPPPGAPGPGPGMPPPNPHQQHPGPPQLPQHHGAHHGHAAPPPPVQHGGPHQMNPNRLAASVPPGMG